MATTMLREWLKLAPVPAKLLTQFADGGERTIKIGSARSRWRDAESALDGAVRCEAIDHDGEVLRVWTAEPVERVAPAVQQTVNDPMAMLTAIAKLLNEAADRSAERHAEAYRLAYEQQNLLVTAVLARLQSLEAAWHEVVLSQRDESVEPAIGSTSDELVRTVLSMAPTVVSGFMNGSPAPAPAPAPSSSERPAS